MAKLHEEVVVLKLSILLRDTDHIENMVTTKIIETLEQVCEELIGNNVLVEVQLMKRDEE